MTTPQKTVEYNSLSWVKSQLDDVLTDAQSNLNEYIENQADEHLENCIEHLQLIFGTLQMVEVYGAAMLAEEMQKTTAALLEGAIERKEDTFDVLMRAMLQLPDYLEKIQAGQKDAPITLMPLFNDLRAARKEGLLTESVLFSPDLENAELYASGYDADAIEEGKLQAEVRRLRTHYQLGLLDFIRNKKERVGLQRIKAVLSSLEKVSSKDEVRRMWMVISALVEGLMNQGIDTNLSIKMLLGAVDRQLKLIIDNGEEDFAGQYSKELVNNVLYYVGLCTVESNSITAVKEAYGLAALMPQESEESDPAIGGLNAELFKTVSRGITDDIERVKDILELFMQSSEKNMEQVVPVVEQLGRIADTYGMLGMGSTRQAVMAQRDVLENIVKGETEVSEQAVSGVAFELLNAESELKGYIASRSGFVDMNRDGENQQVPAAEYRDVVFTVVNEALKNFSEAKEAILSYVPGNGDKDQLDAVLSRLEEVRGVSMMLPLDRVPSQIEKLQRYIKTALLDNNHQADEQEQDTVADVVTSIEYFLEALTEGRPGVEQGLNAGDAAASKLEQISLTYGDSTGGMAVEEVNKTANDVLSEEVSSEVPAQQSPLEQSDEIAEVEQTAEVEQAETTQLKAEDIAYEAASSPEDVAQYSILADDADEEIVEIFIEEAVEVLAELHEYLPQWRDNPDDDEAMAVVRRSFHTLKGSGRILGADLIGEFSWKFENMLNRVIDKKINVSEPLHHALEEALAVLPQLIEQLKGNREPVENIAQLMSSADALADGREVSFDEPVENEASAIDVEAEDIEEFVTEESTETENTEIVDNTELENAVESTDFEDIDIECIEAGDIEIEATESADIELENEIEIDSSTDDIAVDTEIENTDIIENAELEDVTTESTDFEDIDIECVETGDIEIDAAEPADIEIKNEIEIDSSTDDIAVDTEIENTDIGENAELEDVISESTDFEDIDIECVETGDIEIEAAEPADIELENEIEIDSSTDDITVDTEIENTDISENAELEDVITESTDFEDIDIKCVETGDIAIDAAEPADIEHEDEIEIETDCSTDDVISLELEDELDVESDEQSGDEIIVAEGEPESPDVIDEVTIEVSDSDELIDLSGESDAYHAVVSEDIAGEGDNLLDIDPMLLKIYHDESQGHVESIRTQLDACESDGSVLQADKNIIRAFHTLYGSARTAEVESIAELSGAAEKYIKARQDSGEDDIPDEVAAILKEIEQTISAMLIEVADGRLPANNKALLEKINKIVQQEIQTQLQKSWQDNTAPVKNLDITESEESEGLTGAVAIDVSDLDSDEVAGDEIEGGCEDTSGEVAETSAAPAAEQTDEVPAKTSYGDIDDELIDIFLEEAEDLLESCEGTLKEIKNTPNSTEHIHQLQRNMHTLKGGARMADLSPVGDLTHNLESLVVMVDDKKVSADKKLFDILQESLDRLTTMLGNVKQRQPLTHASDLNKRIEMLMCGEAEEKRTVERFDVDLSELASDDEFDISDLVIEDLSADAAEQEVANEKPLRRDSDKLEARPHWGERASDVNFKDSQEQVRVRSDLLNNLVNYAGEVNIYHARMDKQITDFGFNLSELSQTVVRLKEQLRNLEIETEIQIRSGYEKESDSYDDSFDPLEMDQYSTLQQLTRSLGETAADVESIKEILSEITRDSETLLVQESRISTDLQEGLMRTRMVRFGGLSSRLRRIVRQISRELDKEVEVEIIGENSEVDRTVLDRIIAPLEHLLRNAVAHGIEKPEARKILGKTESGKISVEVDRQGVNVVINVHDDGAGINVEKIREQAIKQGLMTAESKLSDHDTLQFIMKSGFTTADEVTQVAGRGVGMDVVDSEIKQLGGVLEINTVAGKSTDFKIRLPLTLAINQALLVRAADDVYAVPLASIEGVVRMTGLELQQFYDSDNNYYEFNGVEYELKHLGNLLNDKQPNYSRQLQLFPVLLVHAGDKHFALHVEDLIGRREIVVKPVGMQIGAVHGIAGATILADGRVVLILEMSALVVAESLFTPHEKIEVAEPVVDDKKTIMVVDDSITIRKITERMLKRYDIEVILAKDGVDATNLLQEQMPDLMLLDIEMPRMDGFEVANYVRNDDILKKLPIIMITSRTGGKHKEKAMKIGVNQYLGKPFQEDDLIHNINKILQTSF